MYSLIDGRGPKHPLTVIPLLIARGLRSATLIHSAELEFSFIDPAGSAGFVDSAVFHGRNQHGFSI